MEGKWNGGEVGWRGSGEVSEIEGKWRGEWDGGEGRRRERLHT